MKIFVFLLLAVIVVASNAASDESAENNGNNNAKVLKTLLENREEVCKLPIDAGNCRAAIKRYAFDAEKQECVEFMYGGCGGNPNKFITKVFCEAFCHLKQESA